MLTTIHPTWVDWRVRTLGFDTDLPGQWARPTPRPAKARPAWPDSRLARDLRWFLGHLDTADTPRRMHRHGVYVDRLDGSGSRIGSPALDPAFERWLLAGEWDRLTERITVPCFHVAKAAGTLCEVCGARDAGGVVVVETGIRTTYRERYRWPMRAAIGRLHSNVVRPGRPLLSSTLFVLACEVGDLDRTARLLARRYPAMVDERTALAHFELALGRVRRVWREDAPPRPDRAERPPSDESSSLAPGLTPALR
jgi:hypothetical protein